MKYLIIPASRVPEVEFAQVREDGPAYLRYNNDNTKTFIKWNTEENPDCVNVFDEDNIEKFCKSEIEDIRGDVKFCKSKIKHINEIIDVLGPLLGFICLAEFLKCLIMAVCVVPTMLI